MSTDTTINPDADEKEPLDLKVEIKEVSACERHVTVTIPRADVDRYFQKQFDELAPRAEVPGFRPGKAPRQLIENRFKPQVVDQVKGALVMDSLTQIGENQDYSAISEPNLDFELINIPDEGDMTYEFDVEVRPEFELPNWKGLKLERPEHDFTAKDIENQVVRFGRQFCNIVPVDEPVQNDDLIICDITCRHEGQIVSRASEESITVRPTLSLADATLENFDELVVGSVAGDVKSAKVEVSEFSDNDDLKGKEVDIEFKILDVKRFESKSVGEIAEKVGIGSEGELKDLVKDSLENQLGYAQRERIREQISESLTESATWELPPDLLRRQSKREVERSVMELRSSGFSEEQIVARENLLRKNILERTERLLKEHFILERIAEVEKVEEEPRDFDVEIARLAAQQNDSPRRIRARLERNGQMDALRNMIIERKVIDLITEHAEFNPVPFKFEKDETTTAINFFVAGELEEIPEARYQDAAPQHPLPTHSRDK